jgi:hypothetical protein
MAYTKTNYKFKKQLLVDLRDDVPVRVFQPGPFGPNVPDGPCTLEGPHYPKPHRWYASCQVKNGRVVPGSVK